MGAKTHKINTPYADILSQFQIIEQKEEQSAVIVRSMQNRKVFLIRELTFNEARENELQMLMLNRKKAQLRGSSGVLQLERVESQNQEQLCSTYFKLMCLWQWQDLSLEQEINTRNLQKRRFQEKELWEMATQIITSLSYLQKQSIPHQCLSSSNVLLSPEGSIKIYDPFCLSSHSNYDSLLGKRSLPHLYISPEEAESLQAQRNSPQCNPYKSDVWTLGIILLEAGLMQYQDECYRDEWSRIHWQTLQFNINRFRQIYSQDLCNLLQIMLSREEAMRPDWVQLEGRTLKIDNQLSQRSSLASQEKQKIYQQIIYSHPSKTFNASQQRVSAASQPPPDFRKSTLIPYQQVGPNPSSINQTRPLRSILPTPFYSTSTKPDQNLILVHEQYSDASDIANNRQDSSYFDSVTKPKNQSTKQLKHKQASVKAFTPQLKSSSSHPNEDFETVVERYRQGSEYRGHKQKGMRHGFGVFLYSDGGKYQGEWKNNKMEGRGCLYYQSGKLAYEGQWISDQFSGAGTLYNEQPLLLQRSYDCRSLDQIEDYWLKYQGQFKQDHKHGRGILFLTNGQYYKGQFIDDIAEGQGVFVKEDGSMVEGTWRNNKLIS